MAETVGRYVLHDAIARGGMATVHAARMTGAHGFSRLVAAKRLHPELTEDPEFVMMLHDEARIASRIHHPNVVPVLDVVVTECEVMLVQEYVHGVPLSLLMRRARQSLKPIPVPVAVAIAVGMLAGLHAAHEARDELGAPLEVIHRDVSPQNVIVSTEGVPRLLDFGIAKARTSVHQTKPGVVKGKLSYMPPEQIRLDPLTRRVDIYAAGIVLWELLANRRVTDGGSEAEFLTSVFLGEFPCLVQECSARRQSMGQAAWKRLMALDAVVQRAISSKPVDRFATAKEMADAIASAQPPASQAEVAAFVTEVARDHVEKLRRSIAESEEEWRASPEHDVGTRSRRILKEDTQAERITIPITECRMIATDESDLDDGASSPPLSLSSYERSALSRPPRGGGVASWLGLGALFIFALAYGATGYKEAPAWVRMSAHDDPPPPARVFEAPPTAVEIPSFTAPVSSASAPPLCLPPAAGSSSAAKRHPAPPLVTRK